MEPPDELLARWVLGTLAPEAVPAAAVDALRAGCEAREVAVLAGLQRPTRAEVEDELTALLRRTGVERPSRRAALKTVVDACAQRVVAGSMLPVEGGRQLCKLAEDFWDDDQLRNQLVCFVWDEDERPWAADAVVEDAQALLDVGGLCIT